MKTIFHNTTRGGKYGIALQIHEDGTYFIKEFKHDQCVGNAWLGPATAVQAVADYNQRIDAAAKYDGIMYTKDKLALLDNRY